jgi:hypothetical protein
MKIEKDIPITNGRASYGWRDMQVGDSVFFDNEPNVSQSRPSKAAAVWGRMHESSFSSRKEGNGVRIWRVA